MTAWKTYKLQFIFPVTLAFWMLFSSILPPAKAQIDIPEPTPPSRAVREAFGLDPFYQQWIDVGGLPVLASAKVSPYAVKEAAYLIHQMIGHRPDILRAMAQNKTRVSVVAYDETITDIPEYSHFRPNFYYNIRNRGLGGQTTSCSEESLLNYPNNPYWSISVLIHEFAHGLHRGGLERIDPGFDDRLNAAFTAAIKNGLWEGTFAATNRDEYWAEGMLSWFNAFFREYDINTRAKLKDYDPGLAALLVEVLGDSDWRFTWPATRLHLPHLHGFNPRNSPTFEWPAESLELYEQLNNPDSDGGGEWVDWPLYDPSKLTSLNESKTVGDYAEFLLVNLTGTDVSLHKVNSDETEVFHARQSSDIRIFGTNAGDIWLLKDENGNNLALFRAEEIPKEKIARVLIDSELLGVGSPGPKIEGPWLWMIVPTRESGVAEAATSKIDWLAEASNGSVTEEQIATKGATAGEKVGEKAWTSGRLAPIGGDNINEVVNAIGLGRGIIDYHVAYGSIVLYSPREQNTWMYAGSDDNHKVWLNGALIHEQLKWHWADDYQESFRVTLKRGKNMLLVAVEDGEGGWGGYFGFENDAAYTLNPMTNPPADINEDGWINVTDLLLVVTALQGSEPANPRADVNADGTVTTADLLLVIENLDDPVNAAAPTNAETITSLDRAMLETQLSLLLAQTDGSRRYQQAIAFLQTLLATTHPTKTRLLANYPNPFNPETWIPYQLAKPADVTLTLYDIQGRVVRHLDLGHQRAGIYQNRSRAAYWDGRNAQGEPVASGVYFYTLTAGDFSATRKMFIRK